MSAFTSEELEHLDRDYGEEAWMRRRGPVVVTELIREVETAALAAFIDWETFWSRDRTEAEWVYPDVLARGRGHALFAGHKVGKSLLMLWVAAKVATSGDDVVVVYLDYEMTEDDLYERLGDMGYGPDTDLSRLRYALIPRLAPLDSPEGASELDDLLDGVQAAHPHDHLVVIIDTMGRAVAGDEDKADTIRAFYRWTGPVIRRRGATWARLDHAGKDASRGQRGSSAKGDDVDVIWKVASTDGGLELRRENSRMRWVPEKVRFAFDETTGLAPVEAAWPAGTKDAASILERLDVPLDASRRAARQALKDAGESASNEALTAALKYRRQTTDHLSGPLSALTSGRSDGPDQETRSDQGGPPARTTADHSRSPSGPLGPPRRGPVSGAGQGVDR